MTNQAKIYELLQKFIRAREYRHIEQNRLDEYTRDEAIEELLNAVHMLNENTDKDTAIAEILLNLGERVTDLEQKERVKSK